MKKVLLALLFSVLAIAGLGYYVWRQATTLPPWYEDAAKGTEDPAVLFYDQGMASVKKSLEQHVEKEVAETRWPDKEVQVVLNENDANKLFATLISESSERYPYLNAIKASRTRIMSDNLDFEVVVNASEMLTAASDKDEKADEPMVVQVSRLLGGREISLGLAGKFGIKNGQIMLDKDGAIRIGNLTFSVSTIMKRLGLSDDQIQKTLKEIELGTFSVHSIQAIQNSLRLKGGGIKG